MTDKWAGLTPKQEELRRLVSGPQTHILNYGGARGGKTFFWCYAIAMRALAAPGSRHLITRLRYNTARRTIRLDTLPKVLRLALPGVPWVAKDRDGYIELSTGRDTPPSEIWIGGLDTQERIDKILGSEYATILVSEASEIEHDTIAVLRTRLAQKVIVPKGPRAGQQLRLKALYDLNPTTRKHWSYREFVEGVSPETGLPLRDRANFAVARTDPEDNAVNLPEGFIESLDNLPRLQRLRFREGLYIADVDGALWRNTMFRRCERAAAPHLVRKVIAVDPSGARHAKDVTADEIGIVVAGIDAAGVGYVLEDLSLRASPAVWSQLVCAAYHRWQADAVVVETNYGGPMAIALIQGCDRRVNCRAITASTGKSARAEPVAGLYERRLVVHAGEPDLFEDLEDQLLQFTIAGYIGARSPDRADALVWALTDLMLDTKSAPSKPSKLTAI